MRFTTFSALALLFGLAACGDETSAADSHRLRPGAVVAFRTDSVGSRLNVVDVARDGDRLVVTLAESFPGPPVWHPVPGCPTCPSQLGSAPDQGAYHVLVSEDLGASWRELRLRWDAWQGPYRKGVQIVGDRGVVVGFGIHERPTGKFRYETIREFSFQTGAYVRNPSLDEREFYVNLLAAGPFVAGASATLGDPARGRGSWFNVYYYDVARGRLTFAEDDPEAKGLDCSPGDFGGLTQAGELHGYCARGQAVDLFCHYAVRPDLSLSETCSPLQDWPAALVGSASGGGLLVTLSDDVRRVFRVAVADDHLLAAVAPDPRAIVRLPATTDLRGLGRGELRPRWSGLLRVTFLEDGAPSAPQFVDLAAPVARVPLPDSPCAGDGCAADLAWALRLRPDEYLLFYTVERAAGARLSLVVTRAQATREPLELEAVERPRIPALPDAIEAPPLDLACHVAHWCLGADYDDCRAHWQPLPLESPAMQRFLAAGRQGCEAMRAAWPDRALLGTPGCAVGCRGDVLVRECNGQGEVRRAIDCGYHDATCVELGEHRYACSDGSDPLECDTCTERGSAVECVGDGHLRLATHCAARGQVCVLGHRPYCADSAECEPATCVDGVAYACPLGTETRKTDCGASGMQCEVRNAHEAGCRTALDEETCSGGYDQSKACLGQYIVYCGSDHRHRYIDCQALGYSRCVEPSGSRSYGCE